MLIVIHPLKLYFFVVTKIVTFNKILLNPATKIKYYLKKIPIKPVQHNIPIPFKLHNFYLRTVNSSY
jgi:hypothetical protein